MISQPGSALSINPSISGNAMKRTDLSPLTNRSAIYAKKLAGPRISSHSLSAMTPSGRVNLAASCNTESL